MSFSDLIETDCLNEYTTFCFVFLLAKPLHRENAQGVLQLAPFGTFSYKKMPPLTETRKKETSEHHKKASA